VSDNTYNSWSNYETWNCALWLDNDGGSYSHWSARAQKLYDDNDGIEDDATYDLAIELENEIVDNAPEVSGMYSDLLSAALREIDFYEIAEHYIADVDKVEPEPEETEDDTEPTEDE
jgi:hypothetical protein